MNARRFVWMAGLLLASALAQAAPESVLRKLRRIFLRAALGEGEVRLLRGILADAQRMAGMVKDR